MKLFSTRYSLFKRIYTHNVGKAIEYMVNDALLAADEYLQLSNSIDDMAQYMQFTDCILREIERSKDPQLETSRQILRRLRRRDLYRCVDTVLVPPSHLQLLKEKVTKTSILKYQTDSEAFSKNDIILE